MKIKKTAFVAAIIVFIVLIGEQAAMIRRRLQSLIWQIAKSMFPLRCKRSFASAPVRLDYLRTSGI